MPSTTVGSRDQTVVPLATPAIAVHRIREEWDALVTAYMLTVDLLADDTKANMANLREAAARRFRQGHATREWALLVLQGHTDWTEDDVRAFLEENPDCGAVEVEEE